MAQTFDELRKRFKEKRALWEADSIYDRETAEKHIGTWNAALRILDAVEAEEAKKEAA